MVKERRPNCELETRANLKVRSYLGGHSAVRAHLDKRALAEIWGAGQSDKTAHLHICTFAALFRRTFKILRSAKAAEDDHALCIH